MKKKLIAGLAIGTFVFCFNGLANAATIVDLIGDKDGFGIGATPGSSFEWTSVGSGDGDGTDVWRWDDYTYTHTYNIYGLGLLTSATLEIFTGGQGWYGLTSLYVDNVLVGTLTDGDSNDVVGSIGYNYAWRDTFDLMPFSTLLNGAETIRIDTYNSGDGWVLDYSQLTLTTSDIKSPVPEPETYAMLLAGLGLLSFTARRRKQST